MDTSPRFGLVLKRLRLAAGLTHEALAERAGVGVRTISDLERGISNAPRSDTLALIVDALDLSFEERALLELSARQSVARSRSLPSSPTNLPFQITSFIGRQAETRSLPELIVDGKRLVTLTGPGGVGKTRLALHVGEVMCTTFSDGVFVVDLAPVADDEGARQAMGIALGLEVAGAPPLPRLIDHLNTKSLLLILDNFEHLLDSAPRVSELLRACPQLCVLVTSRAPLRIAGEQEFPVLPLPTPDPAHLPSVPEISGYPSIALFADRASRVRAEFAVTQENAADVSAICARLDGLPLALELAAARIKTNSPQELLLRLQSAGVAPALRVLASGPRDAPERQKTLRATIAWSHSLLAEREQEIFRRLAVFAGGGTYEAVAEICGEPHADDAIQTVASTLSADTAPARVEGILDSLIEQSLVFQGRGVDGAPRIQMLETIGEFAAEMLVESGEEALLRRRHAHYFLRIVESTGALLFATESKRAALAAEQGNVSAALRWLVQQG
jgi:predicted ATPase